MNYLLLLTYKYLQNSRNNEKIKSMNITKNKISQVTHLEKSHYLLMFTNWKPS